MIFLKLTYLIVGESPGSKLKKADQLNQTDDDDNNSSLMVTVQHGTADRVHQLLVREATGSGINKQKNISFLKNV